MLRLVRSNPKLRNLGFKLRAAGLRLPRPVQGRAAVKVSPGGKSFSSIGAGLSFKGSSRLQSLRFRRSSRVKVWLWSAEVWPAFGGGTGFPSDASMRVPLSSDLEPATHAGSKKYWSPEIGLVVASFVTEILQWLKAAELVSAEKVDFGQERQRIVVVWSMPATIIAPAKEIWQPPDLAPRWDCVLPRCLWAWTARVWGWTRVLGPEFALKPTKGQSWNWDVKPDFKLIVA